MSEDPHPSRTTVVPRYAVGTKGARPRPKSTSTTIPAWLGRCSDASSTMASYDRVAPMTSTRCASCYRTPDVRIVVYDAYALHLSLRHPEYLCDGQTTAPVDVAATLHRRLWEERCHSRWSRRNMRARSQRVYKVGRAGRGKGTKQLTQLIYYLNSLIPLTALYSPLLLQS